MNIEIKNLCKSFGDTVVFRDFNLSLPLGEITVLMGPSGIGKTTLLNIMMGLTPPDAGEITGLPALQSAVFQEDRLIADLPAVDNVALCCSLPRSEIAGHLQRVGLDGVNCPARELSGGMARRVAVVRACLAPGDIILMDEPLSGLDLPTAQRVIDYILDMRHSKTIIAVIHDRDCAERFGGSIKTIDKAGSRGEVH